MLNPSKIKLYYINQGLCKRVTINQLKYSDDTTVNPSLHSESNMLVFTPFSPALSPTI